MLTGLGLAAVLHGAYDRTAGHWPSVFVAAVVVLLFAGYTKTTDDIGARLGSPGGMPPERVHPISTPSPPSG